MNIAITIKADFKRLSKVNNGLSDNDKRKIEQYHYITLLSDEIWIVKQKL